MKKRVFVTGIGVISPVGNTLEEYWQALATGKSGVDYITSFDTTEFDTKFAAEIKNFDPMDYLDRKEARRMDTFTQYAVVASQFAVDASGLKLENENLERIGVIIGSGIGGMDTFEHEYRNYFDKGPRKISPFFQNFVFLMLFLMFLLL